MLGLLFLYAVQLIWRRRRLHRLVALPSEPMRPTPAPADARRTGRDHRAPARPADATGAASPGSPRPVVRQRTGSATWWSAWCWSGALVFLVVKGLGTALNFYLPADQAVHQKATLGTKTFNLEGVVAPGSVHDTATGVDFVVTPGSTRVR